MPTETIPIGRENAPDSDPKKIEGLTELQQRIKDGKGADLGITIAKMETSTLEELSYVLNLAGRTVLDYNYTDEPEEALEVTNQILALPEDSNEMPALRERLRNLLA